MLDKPPKWVFSTVGPTIADSLEPLVHRQNVVGLNVIFWVLFFLGIYIVMFI